MVPNKPWVIWGVRATTIWVHNIQQDNNAHGVSMDGLSELTHKRSKMPMWETCWHPYKRLGCSCSCAHLLGLYDPCPKNENNVAFIGCHILLQLRSYERITIGRPIIGHLVCSNYGGGVSLTHFRLYLPIILHLTINSKLRHIPSYGKPTLSFSPSSIGWHQTILYGSLT